MEEAMDYAALVDLTNFGTVRRYLRHAKSPISGVLFVASEELLPQVAAVLAETDDRSLALRQRRWRWWAASGQIRPGAEGTTDASGAAVDMDGINTERRCHVIYLPPLYLVYMPGLDLARPSKRSRPTFCPCP